MMFSIATDHGCFVQVWGGCNYRCPYREQAMGLLPLGGFHHLHNYQTSLFLQANKTVVAKAVNQAYSPLDSYLSLPLHIQPLPHLVLSSPICYGWNTANDIGGGKNLLQSQFQVLQKRFLREKKSLNANTTKAEESFIAIEEPNSRGSGRPKEEDIETEQESDDIIRCINMGVNGMEFDIFKRMDLSLGAYRRLMKNAWQTSSENVKGVLSILSKIGLSRLEIGLVLRKVPSLVKTKPTKLSQTFHVLTQLGYPETSLAGICLQSPELLENDADFLTEVFEYLQSVGMKKEELVLVLNKRPQVFTYPTDKVKYSVDCLIQAGIPKETLCKVLLSATKLFSPGLQYHLKSRLDFLVKIGLKPKMLAKAITKRPGILGINFETTTSSYTYLTQFLNEEDLIKVIYRYPDSLIIHPVRIGQIIGYLLKRGVKPNRLSKVIARGPCVLGHTITTMESCVQYLRDLGAKDETISRAISRAPQIILCCNYEKNLDPKFQWFHSEGFSEHQVARMFLTFPSMFGQNIEKSLQPKLEYLANEMIYGINEVADFPQYFGFSLENRIKPRYKQASEILFPSGKHATMSSILVPTNDVFEYRMMRFQDRMGDDGFY